jgi:hypothetical protein
MAEAIQAYLHDISPAMTRRHLFAAAILVAIYEQPHPATTTANV